MSSTVPLVPSTCSGTDAGAQGADVRNSWQVGLPLLGYGLLAALPGTLLAARRHGTDPASTPPTRATDESGSRQ